jgi:hypothetical protein
MKAFDCYEIATLCGAQAKAGCGSPIRLVTSVLFPKDPCVILAATEYLATVHMSRSDHVCDNARSDRSQHRSCLKCAEFDKIWYAL